MSKELIDGIKSSRYYQSGSNKIAITSQKSRSQKSNRADVLQKLDSEIQRIAVGIIAKEAAPTPKKSV